MTWDERIATISINPDMASREDVANLASELMEARAEVKRLREALEDMVDQFAYPLDEPPRITTGGLSALEHAFDVLGYSDPKEVPGRECQIEGCKKTATCGTPTPNGYKRVCLKHFRLLEGK
jgi:hypothetical protein